MEKFKSLDYALSAAESVAEDLKWGIASSSQEAMNAEETVANLAEALEAAAVDALTQVARITGLTHEQVAMKVEAALPIAERQFQRLEGEYADSLFYGHA